MPDNPELITDETVEPWHGPILPVHIASSEATWGKSIPPEFGATALWTAPNSTGNPSFIRIGSRNYNRHRLRLWVPSIATINTPGISTLYARGSVTDPGASTNIVSIGAANFTGNTQYVVNGQVYIDGTVTSADDDNMQLGINGVTVGRLLVPFNNGTGGIVVPFGPFYFTSNATPNNVAVVATAAASGAAAVYHAEISVTPLSAIDGASTGSQYVLLSSNPAVLQNGGGMQITPSMVPFGGGGGMSWESQQPLYATCVGGTAIILTLDETFAEVRETLAKETR
jgi:hypothetical protein